MSATPEISVVIPIYNEAETIPELERRLRQTLDSRHLVYEILFIDDGSEDASLELLKALRERDSRIKIIQFSRNFGHQVAITAGIDHARGDAVIVMDGDLQDPPEVLPDLIEHWREGYEVVYAIRRRRKEGLFKRLGYSAFYRLVRRIADIDIPLDSGDFSLMDRKVVDVLVGSPERNRFVRGLRAWTGFRQLGYSYEREARFAGQPKYDLRRLFGLALNGILSFSVAPLRLATNIGLVITVGAAIFALWTLAKRLIYFEVVPGFATITILVLFFGGIQLLAIGILGEYVARIYTEVKGRPRYVVRELYGLGPGGSRDRESAD